MSKKTLNMEMGNLVCRFGKDKVLLDLVDEVFLPCFIGDQLIRSYDKTRYFFYDVTPVKLRDDEDEPVIGIAGRFIKDTTLEREQIFEQGKGLVKDADSISSAPSSMFLLILNNHRLVYVKETMNAPSKETFRSTLLSFLRLKHKEYINGEYNRLNILAKNGSDGEKKQRVTKQKLYDDNPRPSLELIPLTSEDNIEDFIKKYNILKIIEISLSDRNDESDNDPFFEELQKRKDAIGSKKSIVKHSNSKGLDKSEAISEISEATEQGNQKIKLSGTDSEGDTLLGNNEHFQLRKPLGNLSSKPIKAAGELYGTFMGLVDDGLVNVPNTSQKALSIIKSLTRRLFND